MASPRVFQTTKTDRAGITPAAFGPVSFTRFERKNPSSRSEDLHGLNPLPLRVTVHAADQCRSRPACHSLLTIGAFGASFIRAHALTRFSADCENRIESPLSPASLANFTSQDIASSISLNVSSISGSTSENSQNQRPHNPAATQDCQRHRTTYPRVFPLLFSHSIV